LSRNCWAPKDNIQGDEMNLPVVHDRPRQVAGGIGQDGDLGLGRPDSFVLFLHIVDFDLGDGSAVLQLEEQPVRRIGVDVDTDALFGAGHDGRVAVALDDITDALDLQVRPDQQGLGTEAVVDDLSLEGALTSSAGSNRVRFSGPLKACRS